MTGLYKFFKYIILLGIAGIFMYFSVFPNEFYKYSNKYYDFSSFGNFFSSVQNKYKELVFIELSPEELNLINGKEIFINYPQKSIKYQLNELGISFNSKRERIIDQAKFNNFELKLQNDLSYLSKSPVINLENSEFYSLGINSKLELDKDNFLGQLEFKNFLTKNDVRVLPKFKEIFVNKENLNSNLEIRQKITSKPLQLKAGRREINLTTSEIDSFIGSKIIDNKEVLFIDKPKIATYLKDLDLKINFPTDVDYKVSSEKLATHLLFRITEENFSRTFILPITGGFSISPQRHPKFIEVNKSQQRAYLFEGGSLYKTLLISTGVTWETPAGEFKVLNKVPMTISYTNNWYMPWYLPIGTINGKYYFGFHEVPYHMDYNGMIYSRDPETIGSPATGGCIQVLKGQAKELFDWGEVGMPVYITE